MKRRKQLTPQLLKRIIQEEKEKLKDLGLLGKSASVVDADGYQNTLEKHVNYLQKLSIKESNLRKRANKISRVRSALKKRILRGR